MAGRSAEDRLGRLLVMLPWLMEVGEAPLADVAARYGLTEAEVQKDLELVAMCGLPPFVDEMVDVFVDDGLVVVGVPRLFTRPLRLTAPEGFSLLASGRAAMELPGADVDGPLGRGLRKLAAVLTDAGLERDIGDGGGSFDGADDRDDTAGVAIDMDRPACTDELVDAAATGAEVQVEYYSPARDATAVRTIVPRHVFAEAGNWYVVADDNKSSQRRTFRIDRIERMELTGRTRPTTEVVEAPAGFFVDAEVPTAVLRLAPGAQWIIEQYPVGEVTEINSPPGWVEVELPVASERWLARLLIRLGPNAKVVRPGSASIGAADLATQILANY